MLYGAVTRTSRIPPKFKNQRNFLLIQEEVERCMSRSSAYQLLLVQDQWLDKYETNAIVIYEQYFRLLLGFIITFKDHSLLRIENINQYLNQLRDIINLINEDSAKQELIYYLIEENILYKQIIQNKKIELNDLFYCTDDKKKDDLFNVSILASIEIGRNLRALYSLLSTHNICRKRYLYEHAKGFMLFMLKCGYSQASSIKQKNIDSLTWQSYISIAYGKTNHYIDAITWINCILDPTAFTQKRFYDARFCEQFYLDDIEDLYEDSQDGILGMLSLFLIEQGRIAKELISYLYTEKITSQEFIDKVEKILIEIPLLQTYYDKTFLHYNPFSTAERSSDGRVTFDSDNIESILREIFVNSKDEIFLPLKFILEKRIEQYDKFNNHWKQKRFQACCAILCSSGIPLRIIEGFLLFLKKNRNVIVKSKTDLIYYYGIMATIYKSRVYYKIKNFSTFY